MRESIESILIADGWREFPDMFNKYGRSFGKSFETPTRCACNDRPRMQVIVMVYPPREPDMSESFEMELSGELSDGTWIKLFQWAFAGHQIQDGLAAIPRLLAIWEFAANQPSPLTPPQKAEKE